jgi:DNA-binding HxlR family transcriptional regulator
MRHSRPAVDGASRQGTDGVSDEPTDRALDRALLAGPQRYNELSALVAGIAPNVLASRLRHLEAARLVDARPYQDRPRRFEYALTEEGLSLGDVLGVLETWAARTNGTATSQIHRACGTPIEWRPWCPTCAEPAVATDEPVWL